MESHQFADAEQARDNELHVRVGSMMSKVDETLRLLAECRCEEIGRTPVLHYGRVQRRLVRLVLGEESPAVRQRGIHVLQAREYAIEAFAKRDLPGIVRSV